MENTKEKIESFLQTIDEDAHVLLDEEIDNCVHYNVYVYSYEDKERVIQFLKSIGVPSNNITECDEVQDENYIVFFYV